VQVEVHYTFCCYGLSELEDDELLTVKIVLSDVATFHQCGHVNQHNIRISGTSSSLNSEWLKVKGADQIICLLCPVQTLSCGGFSVLYVCRL
jgi:hypothetical protein